MKHRDFVAFAAIVRLMRAKRHFHAERFRAAVRLAYGMNFAGRQRTRSLSEVLAGSSETVRQAPPVQR